LSFIFFLLSPFLCFFPPFSLNVLGNCCIIQMFHV
jgi:hypothetical protein